MLQMVALRLEMRSCLNSYNCAFGGQFPILLCMGRFSTVADGCQSKDETSRHKQKLSRYEQNL